MSAENYRIAWYGIPTYLMSEVFEKKYLRTVLHRNLIERHGSSDILKSFGF